MVSSKCLKTSSPSPLRFLAALMPPWAQTECERLTGTMEKRSTLPPASAILMTAARPARPPPTTMMRGVAAAMNDSYLEVCQDFRYTSLRTDHCGVTTPGCAGLVVPGALLAGAGMATPAGCSGITSAGALGYL